MPSLSLIKSLSPANCDVVTKFVTYHDFQQVPEATQIGE